MHVILDGYTLFDIEYYQKQSDRSKDWYSEIDCLPVVEGIAYFLKDSFKNKDFIFEDFVKVTYLIIKQKVNKKTI